MLAASFTNTIQCPFATRWIIPEQTLREKVASTTEEEDEIIGPYLLEASNIPGVQFWLSIKPSYKGKEECWMTFNLDVGKEKSVEVFQVMKFEAAERTITKTLTFDRTLAASSLVCPTKDFLDLEKNYIVDGFMIVEVTGVISVERNDVVGNNNNGKPSSSAKLNTSFGNTLWNRNNDKDYAVVVGKKEIKVHRCLLGANSAIFDEMFETAKTERNENKIVIKDFPIGIVETGIKLCYDKSLATVTSMNDALLLLQFFEKYDVKELKANFETLLVERISTANVCQLATFSMGTFCPRLKKGCLDFMVNCIAKKIMVLNINMLDGEFAKELIEECLYTVYP